MHSTGARTEHRLSSIHVSNMEVHNDITANCRFSWPDSCCHCSEQRTELHRMVDLWSTHTHRGPSTCSTHQEIHSHIGHSVQPSCSSRISGSTKRRRRLSSSSALFFGITAGLRGLYSSNASCLSHSSPVSHQVKRGPVPGLGPSACVHHFKLGGTEGLRLAHPFL